MCTAGLYLLWSPVAVTADDIHIHSNSPDFALCRGVSVALGGDSFPIPLFVRVSGVAARHHSLKQFLVVLRNTRGTPQEARGLF